MVFPPDFGPCGNAFFLGLLHRKCPFLRLLYRHSILFLRGNNVFWDRTAYTYVFRTIVTSPICASAALLIQG